MSGIQADITIVGLGPGNSALRTVAVQTALDTATRIFVRSHEDVDLDDLLLHENVTDIAHLRRPDGAPGDRWHAAALAVCDAAADGPVVLAIPGHPRFGKGLVRETLAEAAQRGLTTRVLDGISVIDLIATALGVDPLLEGVQCFTAGLVAEQSPDGPFAGGVFTGSPRRPMLFTHVYSAEICAGLAQALRRILPPDHPVTRIEAAGMPGERISYHTVQNLASIPAGPLIALWVPALGELEAVRDSRTLQHIVARLRAPDGCPWDRKQTHGSLRDAIVDEAYEVVDAIDAGDDANLAEELGDLFLLIAMHAQMAEEAGTFTLEDVYAGIATKIVRRHPHVFGDAEAREAGDVVGLWNEIKAQEKAESPHRPDKAADGQPHAMPAFTRAPRVLAKHPLHREADPSTPEERSRALLDAMAAIVDAGDDPERVLREALASHVTNETP
jgi:tetrapyrrole methylase family protein / MazG family protein